LILVDTSVWIQSKRRDGQRERAVLDALAESDELATTGLVVAEVLQGAGSEELYTEWSESLVGPHYFSDSRESWEKAGRLSFELRRRGLETPLSDLVIAMVALENDLDVYANDSHFDRIPGLRRYVP
jgi:predicted nucleic acid-binding protein